MSPIERIPRGTPRYEERVATLSPFDRLRLELVEEGVLADPTRSVSRRQTRDGTVIDMSGLDEHGVIIAMRRRADGTFEFIDFLLY
jgi:hypothetical protein